MSLHEVTLIDGGPKTSHGLRKTLAASTDPRFVVLDGSQGNPPVPGAQSARMVSLLTFDEVPCGTDITPIVHRAIRRGPAILAIPSGSPRDVAHILKAGASDVLVAPFRQADTLGRLLHWIGQCSPIDVNAALQLKADLGMQTIVGSSRLWLAQMHKISMLANTDVAILIEGETGTGKEVCAHAIHNLSARSGQPFVAINSGAVPSDLAENELFGHQAGAFTSANTSRMGMIEQAQGGTLFLDEVDCLPLAVQVKLLRFLQDKQYRPLGSQKEQLANVRVIAATNNDLEAEVKAGRFRQDLYFRINVGQLTLPPLRQRGEDIELLARHFLRQFAVKQGKWVVGFTEEALRTLKAYAWPGNVRELQNVVERAVLFAPNRVIQHEDLLLRAGVVGGVESKFTAGKAAAVHAYEFGYLSRLLLKHEGNVAAAARVAGVERSNLYRLLRKHGLLSQETSEKTGNSPRSTTPRHTRC